MKTYYDCEPTLSDGEVLDLCKRGYIRLEAVVPEEINVRARAFLEQNTSHEPTEILYEDWFAEGVIKNPQAAGAVRSLLGVNFGLPLLMSNHRVEYPMVGQGWHRDGNSKFTHELRNLQVFYLPQDCTMAMGPTEILPGSHLLYSANDHLKHLDRVRGSDFMAGPAGSIFITVYSIWHRRSSSMRAKKPGIRNALKYNYFRTAPPQRDWRSDPDFDFGNAPYLPARDDSGYYRDKWLAASHVAEMFLWLCGKHPQFKTEGGQTWPLNAATARFTDAPYGVPPGL